MSFWIRNAIIATVLIGLAIAFFLNKELLLSFNQNEVQTLNTENKENSSSETTQYKQGQKTGNAAADGLSNFYAKIYGDKKKRKIVNNVIFLPEPEGDLVKLLQAREMIVRPYSRSWSGEQVSRAFRKGETLYQKLTQYSTEEGLEILWWLNKDFIIKDPFRINKDIVKTARQIGNALSGHFPEGINTYFCYRQRTIVFVNEPIAYLNDECIHLN
jgi:hypothetical protein